MQMNSVSIGNIDRNLAVSGTINGVNLKFYNARRSPFCIYGFLSDNDPERFRRIPYEVAERVNPGVLGLHANTSGGRVRFQTNSACVAIQAIMPGKCLMPHMPFLGSAGFMRAMGNLIFTKVHLFHPLIERTVMSRSLNLENGK